MDTERKIDEQAASVARLAFKALFVEPERRTKPERVALAVTMGQREGAQELAR